MAADLKHMLNVTRIWLTALKRLSTPICNADHWIVHHHCTQVPSFNCSILGVNLENVVHILTFSELETFLNNRLVNIDILENWYSPIPVRHSTPHQSTPRILSIPTNSFVYKGNSFYTMTVTVAPPLRSLHCREPHILRRYRDFLHKDSFARKSILDRCKACLNWPSNAHILTQCLSSRNCIQCG